MICIKLDLIIIDNLYSQPYASSSTENFILYNLKKMFSYTVEGKDLYVDKVKTSAY